MLRRSRDERGAILPMAVILMSVMLVSSAFAVDLGIQRVARSDMQALADAVALDLVRDLGGRTKSEIGSSLDGARDRSVARNSSTVGDDPTVQWEVGRLDAAGEFQPINGVDTPNAVRAVAGTSVGFTFAPGRGEAARASVASLDPQACFSVGSYAAALEDSKSPLLRALDLIGVDLTVLGPGGIASLKDASVPLVDLASELGLGTPEELLTTDVSLLDFVQASADALNADETAAATALNALAVELGALPTFKLGDVLTLDTDSPSALEVGVNALDLVTAALFVAAEGHAVTLPGADVNLPGLLNLDVTATIVSPPRIACGRAGEATARSAQIDLHLAGDVLKSLSGLTNATVTVDLGVAEATGTLSRVQCATGGGNDSITVSTTSALVDPLDVELAAKLKVLLVQVNLAVAVSSRVDPRGPQALGLEFDPPPSTALPTAEMTGGVSSLGLSSATPSIDPPGLLSSLLAPVLDTVLNPILAGLDGTLTTALNPVLDLVGVTLGGADVSALSRPTCDHPRLVG